MSSKNTWYRERAAEHGEFAIYYLERHGEEKKTLHDWLVKWNDDHAYIETREAAHYAQLVQEGAVPHDV